MAVNQTLFTSLDLSAGGNSVVQVKGNQGFFIQLDWTGNDANITVQVQGSNDNSVWSDAYMNNGGTLETTTTLTGAADNHGIQFDAFIPAYVKVIIGGTATTGTLNGSISLVDNQDTY
jgi:hypothetical protein